MTQLGMCLGEGLPLLPQVTELCLKIVLHTHQFTIR